MTKKLKAVIVDDEKGSIDSLAWELEPLEEIEVVASFQDPRKAIAGLPNLNLDVLFLDISMPGMTGFEMIEKLDPINFHIVFTTAFDQYAVQAFQANAVDYLLKPVLPLDLKRVIKKIQSNSDITSLQKNLQVFLDSFQQTNQSFSTLALPTMEGLEFVEIEQIIRCESSSNYTFIHQNHEKPILISKTLKDVETMLSSHGFFRIHQSHLVNIKCIKKYLKGKAGSIILKDGTILPVARSKKGDFLDNF